MERHKLYVMNLCRVCNLVIEKRKYSVRSVSEIIAEAYEGVAGCDLSKDNEETESKFVCSNCYNKLQSWNKEHKKYQQFKRKNPNDPKEFSYASKLPPSIEHPVIHLSAGCPCGGEGEGGRVDAQGGGEGERGEAQGGVECTPSKVIKLSTEPAESPSDKLTTRQIRSHTPANLAIKFAFSKGKIDEESGEVVMSDEQVKKVFIDQDSYASGRVDNPEVAKFFLCRICGNFPKKGKFNQTCYHFYCTACIRNFQAKIDTTKCPATSEEGVQCKKPIVELSSIAGFIGNIHGSIAISCKNVHCSDSFKIHEIDQHEASCKKRGSYVRKSVSISESRSKPLLHDAHEAIKNLIEWCEVHNVSPCDFLFFALKKKIHKEAPDLEEPVQQLFQKFLKVKADEAENVVTPTMALALKIDTNLSQRQYVKLASRKVLGKLPGIKQLRKAADELDPGNVFYQVLSKNTGEVLREHVAVPASGCIDVDDDLGSFTFGDININVHGYRASLYDTVCKLFQEAYPDILEKMTSNQVACDDNDRKFKLFVKVAFDGTDAPVKSDKGASRLSVSNWLRGTLCLVAAQVNIICLCTLEVV